MSAEDKKTKVNQGTKGSHTSGWQKTQKYDPSWSKFGERKLGVQDFGTEWKIAMEIVPLEGLVLNCPEQGAFNKDVFRHGYASSKYLCWLFALFFFFSIAILFVCCRNCLNCVRLSVACGHIKSS